MTTTYPGGPEDDFVFKLVLVIIAIGTLIFFFTGCQTTQQSCFSGCVDSLEEETCKEICDLQHSN